MKKTVLKIWLNNCWSEVFPETYARFVKRSDGTTDVESSLTQIENRLDDALVGVYKYQGQVNTFEELPTEAQNGFVYEVLAEHEGYEAGTNWVWDGSKWDPMSSNLTRLESKSTVTVGGEPVETFDADTKVAAEAAINTGSYVRHVYCFSYDGIPKRTAAVTGGGDDGATKRKIPQYNDNANIGSPNDPIEDYEYCRKGYTDTKVASKVGTGFGDSDHKYAYSYDHWTDKDEVYRYMWTTGTGAIPNGLFVPLYNGGKLSGNSPTKPYEYANKAYVDVSINNDCLPKQPTGYATAYNADADAFEILELSIPSGGGYVALMMSNNYYTPDTVDVITDFKYIIGQVAGLGNLVPSGVTGYYQDMTSKKIEGFEILIQTNKGANETPQYDMVSDAYATIDNYYDYVVGTYFRVRFYNADTNENITSKVAHAPIVLIK